MCAEPWPAGAEIRVRVGVDTGEAAERDGDYFGSAVNRVARLRSAARGGEVLVGAATAAIVRASCQGCKLIDRVRSTQGLASREHVYTLAAGDLDPIELDRLAPDSVLPPALPPMLELLADASTFVGRTSERETLRAQWQLRRWPQPAGADHGRGRHRQEPARCRAGRGGVRGRWAGPARLLL